MHWYMLFEVIDGLIALYVILDFEKTPTSFIYLIKSNIQIMAISS